MLSTVTDSNNPSSNTTTGLQQKATTKQRHPMSPVFRGFSDGPAQSGEEDLTLGYRSNSKRPGTGKSRQSGLSNDGLSGSRPGSKAHHRRPSTSPSSSSTSRPSSSHFLLLQQRPVKEQFTNWSPSAYLSPRVLPLVMTGVEALLDTLKNPSDGTYSVQMDKVPGSNGLRPVEWLAKVFHLFPRHK